MSLRWENLAGGPAGQPLPVATLDNGNGLRARVMAYGAGLLELRVPDRFERPVDVVLGFDDPGVRIAQASRLGALVETGVGERFRRVGRCDRVRLMWAPVDEWPGPLPEVTWQWAFPADQERRQGELDVRLSYTVTEDNGLRLDYEARAGRETVVHLGHGALWNLAGGGDILGHVLHIRASRFLPIGADRLPAAAPRPVAGTAVDFLAPAAIRSRLDSADAQLRFAGGGYDHAWLLDRRSEGLSLAASLAEPATGIGMEVWTTGPLFQFGSGNFLDGGLVGKGGRPFRKHGGFCLATRHLPASPGYPGFPGMVLAPGETGRQTILYRFRCEA